MEKDASLGASEFPWLAGVIPGDETDFIVMDEVVACAIDKVGIDISRIHATGMSAGGLQTGASLARRSGYLASVVTFSGGQNGERDIQDPDNLLPAMIVHGGPNDIVILEFMPLAEQLKALMDSLGHFSFICDHGGGHMVPVGGAEAAWQFFQDHPYGT